MLHALCRIGAAEAVGKSQLPREDRPLSDQTSDGEGGKVSFKRALAFGIILTVLGATGLGIHRLAPLGTNVGVIIKRLDNEPAPTIRRSLLLSLGEFSEQSLALSSASSGSFRRVRADDYSRLLRSTAWIRTTTQGVGAGWVVDAKRRWLITNLHVVGDQDRVDAFFVDAKDSMPNTEREHYLENQKKLHDEGKAVRGKVIARRESSDLALVELEKLPDGVAALPLAGELPGPGAKVQSVGHRHDSEALWLSSSGEVRQVGSLTDGYFWRGKKLAAGMPCLIAQLPIHPGDSGGAVANERGEVVGVVSGGRWQAPLAAIVIQTAEVRKLLAQVQKSEKPLASRPSVATEIYRKLLDATVWVRPGATEGRGAGWLVDRERRLILTTASAAGASDLVDVVFPLMSKGNVTAEAEAYADRIELRKSEQLVRGLVLARDGKRDLALIELESIPPFAAALAMATKEPAPAEHVHAVSHPSGVELLWLYASGSIRQAANIALVPSSMGEGAKCRTLLLQLPHQASSSGGPVADDEGRVVRMLAAKEGAQQQLGYAITSSELRAFLDSARPIFAPKTAVELKKRSRYLQARGRFAAATATIGRAIELEPKNAALRRDLVELLIQAGMTDDLAANASFLNRDTVEDAALLTRVLLVTGKRHEAAALCEQVLKRDRKNAISYMVRHAIRAGNDDGTPAGLG